jgi:hypothetical protein
MRARRASVLCLLVPGLAAGGCGDDGSKNRAPSKAAPTKQEFIARADRLCAELTRKSKTIVRQPPQTPDDLVRAARRTTALQREAVSGFEAIGLPEGSARQGAREYVAAIKRLSGPVRRVERSAERLEKAAEKDADEAGEEAVLELQEAIIDLEQADNSSHKIAKKYGLDECAEENGGEGKKPAGPGGKREPA